MNRNELGEEQQKVVWRYVEVWRRFRRLPEDYRNFAQLEDDLAQGSGMLLCGILIEPEAATVITADVKDPKFFAALFENDDSLADALMTAGTDTNDPLWRLPLWPHYDDMLKSDVADLANSAEGGFAGAITAALFLQRFVPKSVQWAHLDTFAWRPTAKPGRPKGGDALGLRAADAMLRARFGR